MHVKNTLSIVIVFLNDRMLTTHGKSKVTLSKQVSCTFTENLHTLPFLVPMLDTHISRWGQIIALVFCCFAVS